MAIPASVKAAAEAAAAALKSLKVAIEESGTTGRGLSLARPMMPSDPAEDLQRAVQELNDWANPS